MPNNTRAGIIWHHRVVKMCCKIVIALSEGNLSSSERASTASKKRDQWITKLYWKSNGKIEIFGKKMYGKEVLLDRVFPLVRLTGQLAYVSRTKVFPTPLPMFALWVVKPHHVIPHLKLLFPKSFSSTNIFSVQFSLFEPEFLTVCTFILALTESRLFSRQLSDGFLSAFSHQPKISRFPWKKVEVCQKTRWIGDEIFLSVWKI